MISNSPTAATVSNTPSTVHEGINYDINSPTAATVSNIPSTAHEGIDYDINNPTAAAVPNTPSTAHEVIFITGVYKHIINKNLYMQFLI